MLMAGVPGGLWVTFAFGAALAFLARGSTQAALSAFRDGGILLVGSSAAGALMGVFIGGGLALASQRAVDSRAWKPALIGGLLAAMVFPAEVLVVALGTDVGPLEMVVTLLAWPVMTVLAAVHSADIAGRTRHHAWLWTAGRRRQQQPSQP
ncbi:hypothetical protein GA0115240_16533 [Streptomyces sp. DvalAA-14]|uniref:hypothetical protein n=1 Tax=unclassified Streptomyces TaxID=2593676 RepID=UPI00081B442E|nr:MULTISPECIES: hypothetical protein [unclassified Streptomyces]SCE47008.1 hypothetical protein GA0115240_16533 [Streptomyces sp. DvalAA-14]